MVSRRLSGIAAVGETPPPSAGSTEDGAGLICVCLLAKGQKKNPSKEKVKKKPGP